MSDILARLFPDDSCVIVLFYDTASRVRHSIFSQFMKPPADERSRLLASKRATHERSDDVCHCQTDCGCHCTTSDKEDLKRRFFRTCKTLLLSPARATSYVVFSAFCIITRLGLKQLGKPEQRPNYRCPCTFSCMCRVIFFPSTY